MKRFKRSVINELCENNGVIAKETYNSLCETIDFIQDQVCKINRSPIVEGKEFMQVLFQLMVKVRDDRWFRLDNRRDD